MAAVSRRIRDPISSLSHLAGAVCAVPVTIVMVMFSKGGVQALSFGIFGLTLFLLYGASAIYHGVMDEDAARIWRRVDHMMIFVLIAGTYTPICVITLAGSVGLTLLCVIWGLAAFGVVLTGVWLKAPPWLNAVIYVAMGWVVVAAFAPLMKALPNGGIAPLLAGGIVYTVGSVLYSFGGAKKFPQIPIKQLGWHEIFHFFILAGSALHVVFMFMYVL